MNVAQVAAAAAAGEADFADAFAQAKVDLGTEIHAGDADTGDAGEEDSPETAAFVAAVEDDATPAAPAAGTPDAGRPAPPADDLNNLLAQTDPRVRAAFDAAQQAQRSDRGRIAAFQRQIAELKAATAAPVTTATESADEADPFEDPAMQEAIANYGDVLTPFVGVIKGLQAELRGLKGTVTADQSARAQRNAETAEQAEETAVRDAHADLDAVINAQEFADWALANPHVMPTIQANGAKIVDASAVIPLLTQFKRETGWSKPAPATGRPAAGNPTAARRARQIESTVAVPASGATGVLHSPGSESFEGAFEEAKAKLGL